MHSFITRNILKITRLEFSVKLVCSYLQLHWKLAQFFGKAIEKYVSKAIKRVIFF